MRQLLSSETSTCSLTGTVGVFVQIALAVLVLIVLLCEYLSEFCIYRCSKNPSAHKPRTFRSFWFDSYKICTGALVSHIFNVVVSLYIESSDASADECAAYALAFYYEACGVPFVQLLQYGVIQWAVTMSRTASVNERCKTRLKWVSKPGIYAEQKSKYPVEGCLRCRDCGAKRAEYLNLFAIVIFAVAISVVAMALTWYFDHELYLVLAAPVLVFIFVITSWLAPPESIWQTIGWICVKGFEKCLWSIFAVIQAGQFAKWSGKMKIDDPNMDAWIYIAIVPIIMNAFMFFMFSRISRLKIPCLTVKYRKRLDSHVTSISDYQPLSEDIPLVRDGQSSNQPISADGYSEDNLTAASHSVLTSTTASIGKEKTHSAAAAAHVGDQSLLSSLSADSHSPSHSRRQSSDKEIISPPANSSSNVSAVSANGDASLQTNEDSSSIVGFNKIEALKVGIIYMLIINLVLYAIAAILLAIKGSVAGVGVLFGTMIGVPLFCSVTMIYVFSYIIGKRINICPCLSAPFGH